MPSYHIHIEGLVQGVGFRPHVHRVAQKRHLTGWVKNGPDGVHIEINGDREEAEDFLQEITRNAPVHSLITGHELWEVPYIAHADFSIHASSQQGKPQVLLTPDVALCAACRAEMLHPANRRYQYPFITCTDCGPRFSILEALPYDRAHTSMRSFGQCEECSEEYHAPNHPRLHSQTNSCSTCGVRYSIPAENISNQQAVRQRILEAWKAGQIVAIKGIGGYMLTCDAHHQVAIQTLRQRKNRPSKPLAVMFPDLDALKAALHCPEEAERLLEGPIAPIVILPQKPSAGDALCLAEIAPGMNTVGAMIPYAPAFAWLLSAWGRPIIATSGNQSGSGILYQDENIHQALGDIADLIVVHNREITFPQDDSVISFGQHPETQIWLRRSRGLAPGVRIASPCVPELPTLAMGADLKACFALNPHGRVIASPYLGDLQHFRPQQTYRLMLTRIQQIQQFSPQVILTDAHPGYASCSLGQEIANQLKIPRHQVQHHEAHFAALLGEHGLCQAPGPVLGFVWDGTGYGSDGQIWGGEVFSYTHGKFRRDACLRPFPQLLGDKMSAEPRLSALSLASSVKGLDMAPVRAFFSPQEWSLYSRLIQRKPPLMTSSMGRLFDGVGAWLLKKPLNHYEGEAAILLEQLARRWEGADSLSEVPAYPILLASKPIDWRPMIREILEDLRAGVSTHFIAYRFHWSLVHLIRMLGRASSSERWGFTGGVFQNSLLGDLIREHLSQEAELYFHQVFPPNDEHLAFGQLVHHHITQSFSSVYSQPQVHVSSHTR